MPARRIVLALAGAFTCGCSEPPPPSSPPTVRRLTFESSSTDEVRQAQRIEMPAELGDWTVSSGKARIAEDEERADGTVGFQVALIGEGSKELLIPLEFDARPFHSATLTVTTPSTERMWLHLVRADGSVRTSPIASMEGSPAPQLVRFYMPRRRSGSEPFEELVIVAEGVSRYVILHSVEFSREPLTNWTFANDEGGGRMRVNNGARTAQLVGPSSTLRSRIEIGPGDELAFSLGIPEVFRNPKIGFATLRLVADGQGTARKEWSYPLEKLIAAPGWRSERVTLDDFPPGQLDIEFSLEAPQGVDLACLIAEGRIVARHANPPTVLLITSDTHRGDHLGAARSAVQVTTPVLDGLAARGLLFEDCFTSTNITNPSHVALMTAVHPRDTGVLTNNVPVAEAAPTLAEAFCGAGYRTFAVVSTRHLGDPTSGLGQGFDRMSWPGPSECDATQSIEKLASWLPDARGEPLFLWLHLFDAHIPYEPPSEFAERYYPPDRDPFDPSLAEPTMPPARVLHESLLGLKDPAYPAAMYRAEVSALDDALGDLLAAARLSDAIIGFTADHGESLGQHGIFFSHGDLYPDSIHVPLILAYPRAAGGTRMASPASQTDLGRTLLDLAGEEQADFPGRNLLSAAETGTAARVPRFALAGNATSASLTHNGWHLILHLRPHFEAPRLKGAEWHRVELYHLTEDPGSTVDLAELHHELARDLRARLVRWLISARDLGWAHEASADPKLLAELARLGYTDQHTPENGSELIDADCVCERCAAFR